MTIIACYLHFVSSLDEQMLSAIVLFSLALVVFGGKPDQEIHLSRAKWDTMLLNYAGKISCDIKRHFRPSQKF